MGKQHYGLSVITYTYNDQALADGLLRSLAGWDGRPREVLVVDDGSSVPFAPPDMTPRARVVRLETNRGPAQAKIVGLTAGSSRFLLSMDADIRLDPDWVSRLLPVAARPEVGIAATPIRTEAGEGLLADYQRLLYSHHLGRSGSVEVMPAGVWLLRREVWTAHGFGDYRERLHEDVFWSRKLRSLGLELRLVAGPEARQIRQLSRRTMVRRGWTWQGPEFLAVARTGEAGAVNALLMAMQRRFAAHGRVDPRFWYYDFLYAAWALTDLLRAAGRPRAELAVVVGLFAGDLPEPARPLFLADLAALLGCSLSAVATDAGGLPSEIRRALRSILPASFPAAVLAALPHLLDENRRQDWDFSFYDTEAARGA